MSFKPFEDEEEVKRIEQKREQLIASLQDFDLEDTERRFILRKIEHITQKLLDKARYGKDNV